MHDIRRLNGLEQITESLYFIVLHRILNLKNQLISA